MMTTEEFMKRLRERGLLLEYIDDELEARFRLSGPENRITEGIRKYILLKWDELAIQFGQWRCSECWQLVDEFNEDAWHMTEEGDMFCLMCWQKQQVADEPEPALPTDSFVVEAQAFLADVLDAHGLALFGPFKAQQVIHTPSGRTWSPSNV